MKATSLLTKQHKEVKALFKKLSKPNGDAAALRAELADNLVAHMAIEQDIFYPRIRELDEDLVLESFEEHAVAEMALKRLLAADTSSPVFVARVTTLKELIEHHVEEEEGDLFPEVEKALERAELNALGAEMEAAFEEAKAAGHKRPLAGPAPLATADGARMVADKKRGATAAPTRKPAARGSRASTRGKSSSASR